ncbi:organic hydroperoxide resistance protein [Bdellovibrio sp. HCB337]|uniref:organic hydroperoxide resistance protein n=1 Tax=Bdellovibrio sp. HCB337 TaxID=3394358 RepID=UPI0039A48C09
MEQSQSEVVHKGKFNADKTGKVFYTAKTHTIGGRVGGSAKSDDGQLDVMFASPGAKGRGTNPEQMFAAGWSACFIGAMGGVAQKEKIPLPKDTAVDAEVDLVVSGGQDYSLQARLNVTLPGIDREKALQIVEAASHVCPYSKAIEGNVEVTYHLV